MKTGKYVLMGFAIVAAIGVRPLLAADDGTDERGANSIEEVEEVEEVEEIEEVEIVESAVVSPESETSEFTLVQIIGRNHPALVHLPIGFIIAVCFLELLLLLFPGLDLGRAGLVMSFATVASFIPAGLAGWLRAGELFAGREPPALLYEHRNLMIGAAVVFVVSVIFRVARRDRLNGGYRIVYLLILFLALLLVGLGGHHGGQMVYGEDFLPY